MKTLRIILIALALLSLVACGNKGELVRPAPTPANG
jgi:predicted small lipoprotein YifL